MLETTIEKGLHKKLIEFAKKHPQIQAIFKGASQKDVEKIITIF